MGEEYLLCELAWWTPKGWLHPEGVKRVLENLETELYPRVESNFNLQVSKEKELSGIPLLLVLIKVVSALNGMFSPSASSSPNSI